MSQPRSLSACRPVCLLLAVLIGVGSLPAGAQTTAGAEERIHAAEVLYLEGDYEGALAELSSLNAEASLTLALRAETAELLAHCQYALGNPSAAAQQLEKLFELDTAYTLSTWTDPGLREEADRIRAQAKTRRTTAQAVKPGEQLPATDESALPAVQADATQPATLSDQPKPKGKRLFFVAAGAAVIAGLVFLAGGGGETEPSDGGTTLDTLPLPPGRPARR